MYVAMTEGAIFCSETGLATNAKDRAEEKLQGRVHVLSPTTGEKLRAPFMPPFATNHKGFTAISGMCVAHDCLWVSSGFGMLLCLPRDPEAKGAAATERSPYQDAIDGVVGVS